MSQSAAGFRSRRAAATLSVHILIGGSQYHRHDPPHILFQWIGLESCNSDISYIIVIVMI